MDDHDLPPEEEPLDEDIDFEDILNTEFDEEEPPPEEIDPWVGPDAVDDY